MRAWRTQNCKGAGRPQGSTDGFSKHQRDKMIAEARAEAKEILKYMEAQGYVLPKDEYAREGIETIVVEMRRTDLSPRDKLAAAKTLLEYTLAKPAAETNVTVKRPEDFLDDLVTGMNLEK